MKNLDNIIKKINLALTNTIPEYGFCDLDFDFNKANVNYDNAVSLFEDLRQFNTIYSLEFKPLLIQIDISKIGKSVSFVNYTDMSDILGNDSSLVTLRVQEPSFKGKNDLALLLSSVNGSNKACTIHYEENSFPVKDSVDLDQKVIDDVINLFKSNSFLIDKYELLKDGAFISNLSYIYTNFGDTDIINGLNEIIIHLGNEDLANKFDLKLYLNLGENFGINYEKSQVSINEGEYVSDKELIDKLFSEIYIFREFSDPAQRKRK